MKKQIFLTIILAAMMPALLSDASGANLDLSPWIYSPRDTSTKQYQSYQETNSHHTRMVNGFNSMDIKYDGKIQVGDDDKSIKSISPGGYLKISYRTFGNKRELLINSDRTGNLSYEFYEGRKEIPFEPEGRKWLEDVLIDVVRSSGIDAEGRTGRIYSRQGIDGFIEEISQIHSTTGQAKYFAALLSNEKLSPRELAKTADAISRKMSSNTARGRLFREYADLFLQDKDVAAAYFTAVSRISSNTERGRVYRNINQPLDFSDQALIFAYFHGINKLSSSTEAGSVLRHTINTQTLPTRAQIALLESVARMSSNTEAGRVLRTFGELDLREPGIIEAYFLALDHMSSNTERGSVLRDLLKKSKVEGPAMVSFLNSCRKLSSSTETSSVLRSIKDINLADTQTRDAYFTVIRAMSSDTESSRVLRYTLDVHQLDNPALISFYETTRTMNSNTETGNVLRASLSHLPSEMAVQDAFFATVNSLSSSTEHGRVLRQYAGMGDLSSYAITGILNSARRISSSTEKGSVLRAVAPRIKEGDSELRDLYMDTAKTLSSDTEFRRAMDAIM
ncbi:MAG: hypothetical protein KAT31_01465 [Bacteroidales bacterium]|nr:hypothetical protein [Bacteroidales bacterium]